MTFISMIKSEIGRGLIYAGDTSLALTIKIDQTGPMQLTVRKGDFVMLSGERFTLSNDVVLDLNPDTTVPFHYRIELGTDANGSVGVLARARTQTGSRPAAPFGWRRLHTLTVCDSQAQNWEFMVPSGLTDLKDIDIFVIAVKPGFPAAIPFNEIHRGLK